MSNIIARMIGDKRQWRAMEARADALPEEYRDVYAGIKTYLWKLASGDGLGTIRLLDAVLREFEAGAASGTSVLEITGPDVAAFCDQRRQVAGAPSYVDRWRAELNADVAGRLAE